MKDYYKILGVSESAGEREIKSAYRKLAFEHHPDKNPGNEKAAEVKFKKINEAFYVLGDKIRRKQYDSTRRGQFAGAGYGGSQQGFGYSQRDIFQGMFSGQSGFEDLQSMFTKAGLRFDQDFINQVFFKGGGFTFYSTGTSGARQGAYDFGGMSRYDTAGVTPHKPNLFERAAAKVTAKLGKFVLKRVFGIQLEEPKPKKSLDKHLGLKISPAEAASGGEIPITYQRGGKKTNLMVRVPAGVKTGTKIRLKAMGLTKDGKSGDLYLHVKVAQ